MPSSSCSHHAVKPKPRKPVEGDVYLRHFPGGLIGAVRVLRILDRSIMLSTTRFLASVPPQPDDAALLEPVRLHRFSWRGEEDVIWLTGKPPAEFEFAFNVAPTEAETVVECNSYGGTWGAERGDGAYLEWRWIHDRPAFEAEVEAERARRESDRQRALLAQKPKRMLAEATFWAPIERLDWARTGDDDAVLAPLVAELAALPKTDIRGFQERLAYSLYRLDTRAHAMHIGGESFKEDGSYFSADWFLYVRCCAVANGRAFYEAALTDPACMPQDLEFESLLSAARVAWEKKTDDDMDYETGCSFESFSNVEGWATSA